MTVVQRDPDTLVVVPDDSKPADSEGHRTYFDEETIHIYDSEGNLWIKSDEWVVID